MFKKLLLMAVLVCISGYCQVKPGENLCINGMLEADQETMPPYWEFANVKYISYNPTGGPDSTGCLIFENLEDTPVHPDFPAVCRLLHICPGALDDYLVRELGLCGEELLLQI